MAAAWRFLDECVLLRCVTFMETRDVGRVVAVWRGLCAREALWALVLERHGWRRRRRSPDGDAGSGSDADVPESTAFIASLAAGPRAFGLRESNGAERSSSSESDDDGEAARAARLRRRFVARWARWVPVAEAMVLGLDALLAAARPFAEAHGVVAGRARRRLASAAGLARRCAAAPDDGGGADGGDDPSDLVETPAYRARRRAVDGLWDVVRGAALARFDDVAAALPLGVLVETTASPLPARASTLRRVRLTTTVEAPAALVRAAIRDVAARRDAWDFGLTAARVDDLRVRGKRTALHRRADVVRLDYGDAHARISVETNRRFGSARRTLETRLARSKRGRFGSFLETECLSLRRRSPEVWK